VGRDNAWKRERDMRRSRRMSRGKVAKMGVFEGIAFKLICKQARM
jgi:hypothetical protein